MSENLFRRLLSSTPPFDEIEACSDRARRGALARLNEPGRVDGRRGLSLAGLAVATGVLIVTAVVFQPFQWRPASPQQPAASSPAAGGPLRVYLTLSDGTKVVWVLDDHYAM